MKARNLVLRPLSVTFLCLSVRYKYSIVCDSDYAMTQCLGCSLQFACLDKSECGKCLKKSNAGSQADIKVIDVWHSDLSPSKLRHAHFFGFQTQPQCTCCGVVYTFLKGSVCGSCTGHSKQGEIFSETISVSLLML